MLRARYLLFILVFLPGLLGLNACSDFGYYLHTAGGHLEVMAERKPIPDLLEDKNTPAELREKLKTIVLIRHFASEHLALPENGSYQSYVELDRPYVVWNVVATPELSLDPLVWCFPLAGCVSYRGYFNLKKAQEFAKNLEKEGHDITVSGIPAYSTLNWFDDPALSTFSQWPPSAIARLIFHELAHQKLYVPDDSAFNESFSTTVELAGTELWLDRFGSAEDTVKYQQKLNYEKQFLELTADARQELNTLYASNMSDQKKRQKKKLVFSGLRHRYQKLRESWNGYAGYDRWFETLNNAKFASISTYHRWVPAFKLVLKQENNDLPSFYQRCQTISRLPQQKRSELLDRLTREHQNSESSISSLERENSKG